MSLSHNRVSEGDILHLISRFEPEVRQPFVSFCSPTSGESLFRYRVLLCEVSYIDHPNGSLQLLIAIKGAPEQTIGEMAMMLLSEVFPPPVLMDHLREELMVFGVPDSVDPFTEWMVLNEGDASYLNVQVSFRWHRSLK